MGDGERRLEMDVDEALLEIINPLKENHTVSEEVHQLLYMNFNDLNMFGFAYRNGSSGAIIDALHPQVLRVYHSRDRKADERRPNNVSNSIEEWKRDQLLTRQCNHENEFDVILLDLE